MIDTMTLPLDESFVASSESANSVRLNGNGISYLLKNPHLNLTILESEKAIKMSYTTRCRKIATSVYKTWSNKLNSFKKNKYRYVVEIHYKHFPIVVSCDNTNKHRRTITVENFYGCRNKFVFAFTKLSQDIVYDSVNRTLEFHSREDVTTGNQLENLVKLRYRTNLKNLDRRVFTDGFYIKKYVV